jgi:hypothetical protein
MLQKATCDSFQKHFQQVHKCRQQCVDTKGQYFEGNYVFDVTSAISAILKWQLVKGLYSRKQIKIAGWENMVVEVVLQYHAGKVTAA